MTKGRDQCLYLLGTLKTYFAGGDFLNYFYELQENQQIIRDFERAVVNVDGFKQSFESILEFRFYRLALYAIVRRIKPKRVVETGVLHGMTTAFILEAMNKNNNGDLFSIDLPSYYGEEPANKDGYDASLPKQKEPGWIIPERLRKYWTLNMGASMDVLPTLEIKEDSLDMFIHDSDHSYCNMFSELEFAWQKLRPGGVLACDNIECNSAFFDFCLNKKQRPLVLPAPDMNTMYQPRFAVLLK